MEWLSKQLYRLNPWVPKSTGESLNCWYAPEVGLSLGLDEGMRSGTQHTTGLYKWKRKQPWLITPVIQDWRLRQEDCLSQEKEAEEEEESREEEQESSVSLVRHSFPPHGALLAQQLVSGFRRTLPVSFSSEWDHLLRPRSPIQPRNLVRALTHMAWTSLRKCRFHVEVICFLFFCTGSM